MSLVRLLGFTTMGCGCVSGRYRDVGTNREVTYIDSVGVGTLAIILKHTITNSQALVLVCGKSVRDVLVASSLDAAFRFAPSVDIAIQP